MYMKDRNSLPEVHKDIKFIEDILKYLENHDDEMIRTMLKDWEAELTEFINEIDE